MRTSRARRQRAPRSSTRSKSKATAVPATVAVISKAISGGSEVTIHGPSTTDHKTADNTSCFAIDGRRCCISDAIAGSPVRGQVEPDAIGIFVEPVAALVEAGETQVPRSVYAIADPQQLSAHGAVEPPVVRIECRHHRIALDALSRKPEFPATRLRAIARDDAGARALVRIVSACVVDEVEASLDRPM